MGTMEPQAPSARQLPGTRLGALAGLAPILAFLAWTSIAHWHGTPAEFLLPLVTVSIVAVATGWIVGSRLGSSIRSSLLGVVAYAAVAWLIYLPVGVIGSTWQGIGDGRISDPQGLLVAVLGPLAYGLVSSAWVVVYLAPFGAVWVATFRLLHRAGAR